MSIFKGFYIEDSDGIIWEHYFVKRFRTYHEAIRILRGYMRYYGYNEGNVVECGFLQRRPSTKNSKSIRWYKSGMTYEAFNAICNKLESDGILRRFDNE